MRSYGNNWIRQPAEVRCALFFKPRSLISFIYFIFNFNVNFGDDFGE